MRTSKKSILSILVLVLLAIGVVLIVLPFNKGEVKEIGIGGIYSLTGDNAVLGQAMRNASLLAVEEINEKGGVGGRQLKMIIEDGKCNGKEARTAAQKLISTNKIIVILEGGCSSEVLGMVDLTEWEQVIIMDIAGTSPEITHAGDLIFRNVPSDAFSGTILADYAIKREYRRVAILAEQTDYAKALRDVFTETFARQNGAIVASESFLSSSKDLRTQIVKIKSQSPDAVFLVPQSLKTAVVAVRQLTELDVDAPLLTTDIILAGDQKEFQEVQNYFEGAVVSQLDFSEVDRERLDDFNRRYQERFGKPCEIGEFYCGYGYEMVYLLKGGLEQCEERTSCLKDYFYSIKDRSGIMGKLTIDSNGDAVRKFSLKVIRNGRAEPLD